MRLRLDKRVLIGLVLVSGLAVAQDRAPAAALTAAQDGPWSRATTADITYEVSANIGSAGGACLTGSECLSCEQARVRIPTTINHAVKIHMAGATDGGFIDYDGGCNLVGFTFGPAGSLAVEGDLSAPAILSADGGVGVTTGTTTSRVTGSTTTASTETDSTQTWGTNVLAGYLYRTTSSGGVVQYGKITSNTQTVVTIEGQFDTATTAGDAYAILTPSTRIVGAIGSYNNIGSISAGTNTLAFVVGSNGLTQLGFESLISTTASPGTLRISNLAFSSGVGRAIGVWGPVQLTVSRDTFANTSNDIQLIGQNANIRYRHNSHSGAGGGIVAHPAGTAGWLDVRNNRFTAGSNIVSVAGRIDTLRGESNEVTAMTSAAYAIGGIGEGQIRYDRLTAPTECVRIGNSTSNLIATPLGGYGGVNVDGITCNNPSSSFIRLQGPVSVTTDNLGTASTGTNSGSVALSFLANGAKLNWGTVTNFTGGLASADFIDTSLCNGAGGKGMTLVQLRETASQGFFSSCSGCIVETDAASQAGGSGFWSGGVMLSQMTTTQLGLVTFGNPNRGTIFWNDTLGQWEGISYGTAHGFAKLWDDKIFGSATINQGSIAAATGCVDTPITMNVAPAANSRCVATPPASDLGNGTVSCYRLADAGTVIHQCGAGSAAYDPPDGTYTCTCNNGGTSPP